MERDRQTDREKETETERQREAEKEEKTNNRPMGENLKQYTSSTSSVNRDSVILDTQSKEGPSKTTMT